MTITDKDLIKFADALAAEAIQLLKVDGLPVEDARGRQVSANALLAMANAIYKVWRP